MKEILSGLVLGFAISLMLTRTIRSLLVPVGATILAAVYAQVAREMGERFSALDVTLSFYNTRDSTAGIAQRLCCERLCPRSSKVALAHSFLS